MSGLIAGTIKSLLQIKPKSRCDTYTDQYHRIFMVKMAMVSSLLLAMNWLKDTMSCIIPGHHGIDGKFTSQACWINGFFIYKELRHVPGMFGYYGIPKSFEDNGYYPPIDSYGAPEPCQVNSNDKACIPLSKTFYLQYQWFPFYMAALALLYYLPYIFYRHHNSDVISLKTNLKAPDVDVVGLVRNYFNHGVNTVTKMRITVLANLCIKIMYIVVNIIAFFGTNSLVNGDFKMYGVQWVNWKKQPDSTEYDYTAAPKGANNPASVLLPTFGLCEVLELGKDIKHTLYNKHQFVCEISQNVLYQYVLLILWFLFVIGVVVSVVGFIIEVCDHLLTFYAFMAQGDQTRRVYQMLTIRECQYLEYIRKKDINKYGEVVRLLKKDRLDQLYNPGNPGQHDNPMYGPNDPYAESKKLLSEMNNE